jgi:glutaconyl-CoA decarboxylase
MMRRYTLRIGEREFVVDVDDVEADRFSVRVGDEAYDVTLAGDEDLSRATITPQLAPASGVPAAAARPASAAAARPKPVASAAAGTMTPAAATTSKPAAGGARTLTAPMPGVILEVHVQAGANVERGDEIATLEAMKMQNAIRSPRAGRIAQVHVAAGQSVGHGEAIVSFEG